MVVCSSPRGEPSGDWGRMGSRRALGALGAQRDVRCCDRMNKFCRDRDPEEIASRSGVRRKLGDSLVCAPDLQGAEGVAALHRATGGPELGPVDGEEHLVVIGLRADAAGKAQCLGRAEGYRAYECRQNEDVDE